MVGTGGWHGFLVLAEVAMRTQHPRDGDVTNSVQVPDKRYGVFPKREGSSLDTPRIRLELLIIRNPPKKGIPVFGKPDIDPGPLSGAGSTKYARDSAKSSGFRV